MPVREYAGKKLVSLSDCDLGRYRNLLSNDLDIRVQRGRGSSEVLRKLAGVVMESQGRGLPPGGALGVCRCKYHDMRRQFRSGYAV